MRPKELSRRWLSCWVPQHFVFLVWTLKSSISNSIPLPLTFLYAGCAPFSPTISHPTNHPIPFPSLIHSSLTPSFPFYPTSSTIFHIYPYPWLYISLHSLFNTPLSPYNLNLSSLTPPIWQSTSHLHPHLSLARCWPTPISLPVFCPLLQFEGFLPETPPVHSRLIY